jgi:hypothetical protein
LKHPDQTYESWKIKNTIKKCFLSRCSLIPGGTLLQDLELISETQILIQAAHEKVESQYVGRKKEYRKKERKN